MRTIDANAVRGHSYESFFYMKIYYMKVSLHENFQIYSSSQMFIPGMNEKYLVRQWDDVYTGEI